MTSEGIEILIAVTATLSFAEMSSMDLMCGALVFRYIGCELIEPTPTTSILPLVRSQSVSIPGTPPEMKCAEPDRSASFTAPDPLMFTHLAVTLRPASRGFLLDQLQLSITISGRKPTPSPRVIVTSLTSARAYGAPTVVNANTSAKSVFFISSSLEALVDLMFGVSDADRDIALR